MMKNNLTTKIFKYLAIFSLCILLFLFFFQVIFLDKYYEWTKTRTIRNLTNNILITENSSSLYNKLDKLSYEENVCIELIDNNLSSLYSSNGKACHLKTRKIKTNFINSKKKKATYNLINPFTKERNIMTAT